MNPESVSEARQRQQARINASYGHHKGVWREGLLWNERHDIDPQCRESEQDVLLLVAALDEATKEIEAARHEHAEVVSQLRKDIEFERGQAHAAVVARNEQSRRADEALRRAEEAERAQRQTADARENMRHALVFEQDKTLRAQVRAEELQRLLVESERQRVAEIQDTQELQRKLSEATRQFEKIQTRADVYHVDNREEAALLLDQCGEIARAALSDLEGVPKP